jgi:hypothetical protein
VVKEGLSGRVIFKSRFGGEKNPVRSKAGGRPFPASIKTLR